MKRNRVTNPEIETSQELRFVVRASKATKAKLRKTAKELGTTMSEFVRACVVEADKQLKDK